MLPGLKSRRFVFRHTVRLRREGGSLTITIPRYIVRHWALKAGEELVVRSTQYGMLLRPRFVTPAIQMFDVKPRDG